MSRTKQALRDEFMISMNKVLTNIKRTIQQLEGELKLIIPEVELPDSVDEVLKHRELRAMVIETCSQWSKEIRVSTFHCKFTMSRIPSSEWVHLTVTLHCKLMTSGSPR